MGFEGVAPPVPPAVVQVPAGPGWIPILTAFAGVLGLLGVVVGAVVTARAQAAAARRSREAAADADARDAVRELLAASVILEGFYETVWQVDLGPGHPQPHREFDRALESWASFQHARARVRLLGYDTLEEAADKLNRAHKDETDRIELYYLRAVTDGKSAEPLADTKPYNDAITKQQRRVQATLEEHVPPRERTADPSSWRRRLRPRAATRVSG